MTVKKRKFPIVLKFLWRKKGRIHGNPAADGWAGAIMRKPQGIQKCDGHTIPR